MTFIAYLNWLMLTRLVAAFWPGNTRPGALVIPVLAQLIGLSAFTPSVAVVGVGCGVVFFQLPMFRARIFEALGHRRASEPRLVPLLGAAAVASFLFNGVQFDPSLVALVTQLTRASILSESLAAGSWRTLNAALFGLLLLTNEVNLVIRWLLRSVQREPTPALLGSGNESPTPPLTTAEAEAEYNAGRVIGIVERYLMFGVILFSDNYEALAFILAAKGFARFKQMEQRAYAEYVLIGTLLSTLSAIAVAELVRRILA
jgi:hypothetical protein